MITILTWFWRQPEGRARYSPRNVNIWADSVRRNVTVPHRIACVTRITTGLDPDIEIIEPPSDFEHIRIPTWGEHMPQCLRRLSMFRPDAGKIFGDRFLCMDLDSVIGGSLDPLLATDVDFKMFRGTSPDRPYNGSMLLMKAGARSEVYETFSPEEAAKAGEVYIGSDQAWISYVLGFGEETWSGEDGVLTWSEFRKQGGNPRVVFFPGKLKPWDSPIRTNPWVQQHYRKVA